MRGIHRSPVNSPHKGQWRGALMFSLICAWINGWVNNREAVDLRRHRAHYGVTVMCGYIVAIGVAIGCPLVNIALGNHLCDELISCQRKPLCSPSGCIFPYSPNEIQSLQWRHNGRDGVSNHQPHDGLLNRLFRCRSKKTSISASLAFVRGIHRWPVNSQRKGPATRRMFPFDDVIMMAV